MLSEISKTVTELGSEGVTRTEVKTHLNITDTGWDTEIDGLITQCRMALEAYTGRSLVYKRIVLYCELDNEWWLPYGPVIGIEGVATKEATIGSGIPDYTTLETGWEVIGGDFKKFKALTCNELKITYTAGYTTLPASLKLALLNEIYFRFENKGQTRGNGICEESRVLADPYRRLEWL